MWSPSGEYLHEQWRVQDGAGRGSQLQLQVWEGRLARHALIPVHAHTLPGGRAARCLRQGHLDACCKDPNWMIYSKPLGSPADGGCSGCLPEELHVFQGHLVPEGVRR